MACVVTFGCRLNAAESEAIRAHAGHLADTIVVNTCAVTTEAERQARHAIARLHREQPDAPIVVTGCAAQIDRARWASLPGVTRVLGNQEKMRAESWRSNESAVGAISAARGHMPVQVPGMVGRARAFLDVQQGCDHSCTFCIIPQGRGPNRSVPPAIVAAHLRGLVEAGQREVVLTGVDLASWGSDLPGGPGLGEAVRQVLAGAPGLARLRLSSLDPAALDDAFWDVLATEPRLMPHLHLSVQAGSDMVLKRMRRRHDRSGALAVIAQARRVRPDVSIGADLIAGFPTESEAQAADTLAFVDEAAIPYLHVFPYSARPGTPASRMPQVPMPLRRERAARLRAAALPHAAALHGGLVGQERPIVVERGGRGHTPEFAPVRFHGQPEPGALVHGRIVRADAAWVEVGWWR